METQGITHELIFLRCILLSSNSRRRSRRRRRKLLHARQARAPARCYRLNRRRRGNLATANESVTASPPRIVCHLLGISQLPAEFLSPQGVVPARLHRHPPVCERRPVWTCFYLAQTLGVINSGPELPGNLFRGLFFVLV
nr:hypothetical protein Itr_chr10CG16340 [Ipomoea trifida]